MKNYTITEKDIESTISDFEIICKYLEDNRPKLTKTREELGKKDCYAINTLISRPRDFTGPRYMQASYPTINLFYYIIKEAGFFNHQYDQKDNLFLVPSAKLAKYRELNPFSRYLFLFKIYWTLLDFDELNSGSMVSRREFHYVEEAFKVMAKAEPEVRIFANVEDYYFGYEHRNPIHWIFVYAGLVVHHLRDFNFWEYEETQIPRFNISNKEVYVKAVTPTSLGMAMIKACCNLPEQSLPTRNKEPFEKAFEPIFPAQAIDGLAINQVLLAEAKDNQETVGNTFIFKVWLEKNVWRRIKLASTHTIEQLHEAILAAFDFDNDHLYAFFMDGKPWSKKAYWAKGVEDKPTVDKAVLGKLGLTLRQKFLYLFDFGDQWQFTIQLEEVMDSKIVPIRGEVIEKKGNAPDQYPDHYFDWEE